MQQDFLNIPQETWNIIFLVIRYVMVALILAYFTNVFVKRKDIYTDIKGRVLERRIETYKSIHRWVMRFQSVIAAPNQDEEHYRNILKPTRFKIGYQGMEYASFFDTPELLLKFGKEVDQMIHKEGNFIDYPLMHQLESFQYWLDDVISFYGAFVQTESDKRWKFCEEKVAKHCELAIKVMGIALQKDVNSFYHKIDNILRKRLGNIRITGVYTESWLTKCKRKACVYCENTMDKNEDSHYIRIVEWFYNNLLYRSYGRSQLERNQSGLMQLFILIHFEEYFADNPDVLKNKKEFMRLTTEFYNCYIQYLER